MAPGREPPRRRLGAFPGRRLRGRGGQAWLNRTPVPAQEGGRCHEERARTERRSTTIGPNGFVWVPIIRLPLCDLGVFVEEAAESVSPDDLDVGVDGVRERPERACMVQRSVWAVAVEMGLVLGEDLPQVA